MKGSGIRAWDQFWRDRVCAMLLVMVLGLGASPIVSLSAESNAVSLVPFETDWSAEEVEARIYAGADVNEVDDKGMTPLLRAAQSGASAKVIARLIAAGGNIHALNTDDETALMLALRTEHDDTLDRILTLIAAGSDVNHANRAGQTPLMLALMHQVDLEVIKALLMVGAQSGTTDERGRTPLMLAARHHGNEEVVLLLLASGADVNGRDADGHVALDHLQKNTAMSEKQLKETEWLLQRTGDH